MNEDNEFNLDFTDIKGREDLKSVLEIDTAESHNMIIIGPPGVGKTMAVLRLPTILPKILFNQAIEVTKSYSVAELLQSNGLFKNRPFRAPHHTTIAVSIIGGGRIPKPGEVLLRHNRILFLDEIPEFEKDVFEISR